MCIQQLRWKDERVFAWLTDEEFLGSIIPSQRVKYAEAVWNWGLARNNLNAPMFKPKDWATYMGESDEVDDML